MGLCKTLTMISLVMADKQSRKKDEDVVKQPQWLNKGTAGVYSIHLLYLSSASSYMVYVDGETGHLLYPNKILQICMQEKSDNS